MRKLQVNQHGSWRNVIDFDDKPENYIAVSEAVLPLAGAMGNDAKWRIVEGTEHAVIAYCEWPNIEWVAP